jgi:hypothetical protein
MGNGHLDFLKVIRAGRPLTRKMRLLKIVSRGASQRVFTRAPRRRNGKSLSMAVPPNKPYYLFPILQRRES